MKPVVTLLDTAAGPNLIETDQLPKDWPQSLEIEKTPYRARSATNTPIPVEGTIRLLIQVGFLAVRVRFLVVRDTSVPCILGASYMDRHVEDIHCRGQMLELSDKSVVAISKSGDVMPDDRARQNVDVSAEALSSKLKLASRNRIHPSGSVGVRSDGANRSGLPPDHGQPVFSKGYPHSQRGGQGDTPFPIQGQSRGSVSQHHPFREEPPVPPERDGAGIIPCMISSAPPDTGAGACGLLSKRFSP